METIDLLVKGLRSSPIAKGRIRFLILSLQSLSFSPVLHCTLYFPCYVIIDVHKLMVSNNFEFECQINHESILILGDAYIVLGCVMVAHHSLVYKVSTSLIGYYQQPQSIGAG